MTLKHFIERPVLASVISIVIVIAGIIGLASLPVEQYPDIAPPTVMVRATYPGANAETIQKSVIVPLEEAINGVENMMYIQSEASNSGSASITVYFRQGTDPDMAAVNVQNKVATATDSAGRGDADRRDDHEASDFDAEGDLHQQPRRHV